MTQIVDAGDRLHVMTGKYEWTILRRFAAGRGPCYISDVRQLGKPNRQVVSDGGDLHHTINDARFGGLFAVGMVAAIPPKNLKPEDFWKWGWEITLRLDAGPSRQFGVVDAKVTTSDPSKVFASCGLNVAGRLVAQLTWDYTFGPGDQVTCQVTITPHAFAGLWIKEPKVTANGLHDFKQLAVLDKDGNAVGKPIDLTKVTDPTLATRQIPSPKRYGYVLSAPGKASLTVACDNGIDGWSAAAQAGKPMSQKRSPAYCLKAGKLWRRTELTRWGQLDIAGLLWHGWEGGAGADDCLTCFRPWPTKPIKVSVGALVGAGKLTLPVDAPPSPPKPPQVRWPDALWNDGMVLYETWGCSSGQWTPEELAAKAAAYGFRAVSFEITPENIPFMARMRDACRANKIGFGVWERSEMTEEPTAAAEVAQFRPDFYEADWEITTGQNAVTWAAGFDRDCPDLPRRLLATGGGIPQPVDALPWLKNWDLAMQDYYKVNPNATPDGDENFAYWRGFPFNGIGKRHYPVLEVDAEGSGPLGPQLSLVNGYRNAKGKLCIGIYDAPQLTDESWAEAKAAA